jgi:hypothetical protein
MNINDRSLELLKRHLHLLPPNEQKGAYYGCDNWPIQARLPKGIATLATSAYGFRVNSLTASQRVVRELFLESASLARQELKL